MKLEITMLQNLIQSSEVMPGNIYPAKAGRRPGTYFWLVIATSDSGAHLIGFNKEGEPVSTASYLKSAMRERPVIGKADIAALTIGAPERLGDDGHC